jgi:plastocyanin
VQPATLPAGPFLAYDRDGRLVSTIYMIPVADIEAQKKYDGLAVGAENVVEIRLRSDPLGTKVWFDPIGILIEPGQTVRWVNEANVHTSTAYHPANDGHALRIPEAAAPWDSGYLVEPGDRFEVTLAVPGVYDYFCAPHEMAGMVGRIIVGRPGGPGTLPFDYFQGDRRRATGVPCRQRRRRRSRLSRRS